MSSPQSKNANYDYSQQKTNTYNDNHGRDVTYK